MIALQPRMAVLIIPEKTGPFIRLGSTPSGSGDPASGALVGVAHPVPQKDVGQRVHSELLVP